MPRIVRAQVYEQLPHPMLGPASFYVTVFDDWAWVLMDRRRIKRERNKAVKKWRAMRRKTGD